MRYIKKIFLSFLIFLIVITIIILAYQSNKFKNVCTHSVRLDARTAPNETIMLQHISNEIPYLPIEDLNNNSYKNRNFNNTCAWYPTLLDINIQNNYWQKFHNRNITYYIFGAYLDNRKTVIQDEPVVRILTTMHFIAQKDEDYPQTHCQLWYKEQKEPIIMPAKYIHRLWHFAWGHRYDHSYGHLISCALPMDNKNWIPRSVSLVATPCDKAFNNVRLTYMPLKDNEVKQGFAVCIKGLDFPYVDMSHRLVEYFETLRSLGVNKIIMYNLQVHANITKVLKYYEQSQFIEYRPYSLPWKSGNLPEYRHLAMEKSGYYAVKHEVIPYNDCFYRNMYRYKYIANADIDELLMPLNNFSNWQDLVNYAENITDKNCKKFASYCFRCTTFPLFADKPQRFTQDIPEYFYMLQHVYRVNEHIKPRASTKCLHNTDLVIGTHNHLPMHYIRNICDSYSFNPLDAQLQHYRNKLHISKNKENLKDAIIDKSLWRYKDEIIQRSIKVFKELNFLDQVCTFIEKINSCTHINCIKNNSDG